MFLSRRSAFTIQLAIICGAVGSTCAGTVDVVTPYPKEVTQAYKGAFESRHPEINLSFQNKSTAAAVTSLRTLPFGQRPSVFWASAPDAFEILSQEKLLVPIKELRNPAAPEMVGSYPVNDPDGFYLGQAIGGYGIMWNTRYLRAHNIAAPASWMDLTKSEYFNHLALSSAAQSGTTHLIVESILQEMGWDKGWALLLQIAGNSAAVTERSFGVPDGVSNGQYGIGLVIDFFALASQRAGYPVGFIYPPGSPVLPASIGLVVGGRNELEARKFIEFTLSEEGQRLLTRPQIARVPLLESERGSRKNTEPQLPAYSSRIKPFDVRLSRARYRLVSSLFDQTITFQQDDLRLAAKAIHAAESRLKARPDEEQQRSLERARMLAFAPVLSETQSLAPLLLSRPITKGKISESSASMESGWYVAARDRYRQARDQAERVGKAKRD